MNHDELIAAIQRRGFSPAGFVRFTGVSLSTFHRWGDVFPVPQWVLTMLDLIDVAPRRHLKEILARVASRPVGRPPKRAPLMAGTRGKKKGGS